MASVIEVTIFALRDFELIQGILQAISKKYIKKFEIEIEEFKDIDMQVLNKVIQNS